MTVHRKIFSGLALVALLAGAGCGGGDGTILTAETDEAGYRQGQQLMKQGRTQEALVAYQKVIARRPDAAPESHLEAGLICLQFTKDPVTAIYHFREYLRLQPNSRQARLVNQRIDVAMRDLARTLPLQPFDNPAGRTDLSEQIDRLQRENELLKAELASIRTGAPATTRVIRASADPSFVVSPEPVFAPPTISIVSAGADPQISLVSAPPPAGGDVKLGFAPARAAPARPAPAPARTYTVEAKDTLWSVVKKIYGTATTVRVRALVEANRDVLPNGEGSPLKPGMELKVP